MIKTIALRGIGGRMKHVIRSIALAGMFAFACLILPTPTSATTGSFTIDRIDWYNPSGQNWGNNQLGYPGPIQCHNQSGGCQFIAHITGFSPQLTDCASLDFKNATGGNIRDTIGCTLDGSYLYMPSGWAAMTDPGETGIDAQFIIHDSAG